MCKKHKKEINAWIDGAVIQFYSTINLPKGVTWVDCDNNNPSWTTGFIYRVKPEKPCRIWGFLEDGVNPCDKFYDSEQTAKKSWLYLNCEVEPVEFIQVMKD